MKTVDISKYSTEIDTSEMQELIIAPLPDIVPNRVLNFDADIALYECTYDETKSFDEVKENLLTLIEKYRLYAGAERVVCHLTGELKGNRFNIATVKPYQGNRNGKSKPKMHGELKNWLTYGGIKFNDDLPNTITVYYNHLEEADDSLTQFHHNNPNSVMCSRDKDLRMNSGLHLNWDTFELHNVDPFGYLEIREHETKSGNKKRKVYGEGTLWFWFQMLAGDTADNIAGLPRIQGKKSMVSCGDIRAYEAIIEFLDVVALYNFDVTDEDMYNFVLGLYEQYYVDGSEHGRTKEVAKAMLIEQAKLLWMRRQIGEDDCLRWFKELGC